MQKKPVSKILISLGILVFILLAAGCARKIVNTDRDANVTVSINTKMLMPGAINFVDHFELLIEGSDFGSIIVPMIAEGGFIIAEVEVPSGRGRRFVARALDKGSVVLYEGEAFADIAPGVMTSLDINLFPVVPMINITPHYQSIVLNDSFYVDVSIFHVPNIASITFDLTRTDSPTDFLSVVKGDAYGDTVEVWYEIGPSYLTTTIGVYNLNEVGTIVDSNGYAHLARVWFRSYRDWPTDTATVLFQVQPTFIYDLGNIIIPLDSIYTDRATVELYWDSINVIPTWEKTIGGGGFDAAYKVCPAHDGGYIIAGGTDSYGAGMSDVYLARIDESGNPDWEKTYGGPLGDVGYCVAPTSDGGYIIAGSSDSFATDETMDFYLVKTDASGNMTWQNHFSGGGIELGRCVRQTPDGGFIIAGVSHIIDGSFAYLVKTNQAGDSVWAQTYIGGQSNAGHSVVVTPGGDYIVAGSIIADVSEDVFLLMVDNFGAINDRLTYGGGARDAGRQIIPTPDGGYAIVGYSGSSGAGSDDVYLVKTDAFGQFSWSKTYGFPGSDYGYGIAFTRDGGYILAGGTQPVGAPINDLYLIRTTSTGSGSWYSIFGGAGDDVGHSVMPTPDGGFLVVGETDSFGAGGKDIYLIKTDARGIVHPALFAGN
jgi:hypothetical protein